ncbi:hypothetical protein Ae168Ps1_2311 [Pseudonocardia sp. Ae168_Ps1]|nr:hypothetical protein Ae168Ps1_2311 [Pseudonocardia sp. Ae168_Ps1]OLL94008.1 hypothetical protein Ae356Ps1_3905 [Pseudonocardia sp. Ae356_Ps1]
MRRAVGHRGRVRGRGPAPGRIAGAPGAGANGADPHGADPHGADPHGADSHGAGTDGAGTDPGRTGPRRRPAPQAGRVTTSPGAAPAPPVAGAVLSGPATARLPAPRAPVVAAAGAPGAPGAAGAAGPASAAGAHVGDVPPSAGDTVLVARTLDDVPADLPPGLVVVLPGGFRMRSGRPAPLPGPPAPEVEPPDVVPPDAPATRVRAAELTRLVAEVLTGRRAPAQLGPVVTPQVLRYLTAARTGTAARPARSTVGCGGRAGAPGCGTPRPAGRWAGRVHVAQPHPDAAEVCTTLPVTGRTRALVLRLDRRPGGPHWRVTAVRLL